MDLTHVSGDESDSGTTASKIAIPGEEYDPSHPLDSSDEDEEPSSCPLTIDTSDTGSNNNNVGVPSVAAATSVGDKVATTTTSVPVPKKGGQPSLLASLSCTSGEALLSSTTNLSAVGETAKTGGTGKEVDIDLSSIPMPSDEYRRPTIQFSIPTRHRLMSISSLIKRQKGVMKKADKDGGSAICYNSEVSKAFNKADGEGEVGEEERPKVSLVQEIFGSDDEDNLKDQEDTTQSPVDQQADGDSNKGDGGGSGPCLSSILLAEGDGGVTSTEHELLGGSNETGDDSSRWKTLEKSSEGGENNEAVSSGGTPPLAGLDSQDEDENSGEEIRISIKPPSELLEAPGNENSSEGEEPEIIVEESAEVGGENDNNSRGKENKQIILECVSDEEPDFEVTFVGIRRPNVGNSRNKPGQSRLSRRNTKDSTPPPRRRSSSPLNGFEEGEIVEMADRKKKKAKKKKSKKRKRSKDSRMSSSKASERSAMDSPEKNKSFSENSDSKEVSWRKPKMAKSRNYRNGKRESPDKHATDRPSRTDDSYRRRSPGRYSSANERLKSRRQRSLSNSRFRSRSRSSSRSSPSRWDGRSRGSRLGQRGESHRSRSSISNHSSPSFSRSRSLTKKRGKRRHSPSPIKRHKNGRSVSKSPPRPSKSPRLSKRHRTNGTEATKRDKVRERSTTPLDTHSLKKTLKPKVDEPLNQETKKKSKKEKTSAEDTDKEKEKRKKRKRKEKSLSPVKAIVADGDSIVVSLSFQKAKEEVPKTPKVTPPAKLESSSVKSKVTNNGNDSECSDDDDSSEKEENTNQPSPKKSTFTINLDLDGSPRERHDSRRSPDVVVLDDNSELSKKSESKKAQEQKADSIKNSSSGSSSQRMDGLDFVSSSHECSVDATQNIFPSPGDPKATPSSAERNSTSKSPYKFSEYFVSSTCGDLGKASSPVVDLSSPRVFSSGKPNDASGTSYSSKNRESSPFSVGDTSRNANSCNNGMDKLSPPSPEPLHSSSSKNSGANTSPTKPMIGNIPGLFPSGFSSSLGGVGSAPPVVIPAPPRIIPNTSTSNLINPNVLVSVASALYAPLLAAKQHGASTSMGQAGGNVISNLQRHGSSANAFFSKSVNSHSQPFGLYNNRTRNGPGEQSGEGGDSPFSPNSSDGDDLFEPPGDGNNTEGNNSSRKSGEHHQSGSGNPSGSPQFGKYQNDGNRNEKQGLFDTLFSTTPKKSTSHSKHSKKKTSSHMKKSRPKNKSVKDKRPEPEKNGEGTEVTARLNEEVPVSAVALKMKEKYLKKLNRQERVVEEVKLCLKPHYSKKHVNKEEYKEILRKAVPKICHNKSGEINPNKIKELVEAYVKKFRKARKSENSAA